MVAAGNPLGLESGSATSPGPASATSTVSAARAPGCCSTTSSGGSESARTTSTATPREEPTHLAVAAAVAAGRADAGLGIMAAARAFGLDFVPVTQEPYDLVVAAGAMDSPLLAPLWSLLRSDRFQAAVTELGGYSTKEMGRRIR